MIPFIILSLKIDIQIDSVLRRLYVKKNKQQTNVNINLLTANYVGILITNFHTASRIKST